MPDIGDLFLAPTSFFVFLSLDLLSSLLPLSLVSLPLHPRPPPPSLGRTASEDCSQEGPPLRTASKRPWVSDVAVRTWAPGIEQENKLAQLSVAVFPAGRGSGTQQVSANDCIGRAREADGDCVLCLVSLHSCPGITYF